MMPERDEWWRITDAEWREFQSIPEQGYSHRYWIESRLIATRLNGAIDRIKGTQPSEQNHTNGSNLMGFGDERGDGGYRESFLSHYAADVTVPQPSDPSAACPKCGVTVTDQTPSGFYPAHDARCGGPLNEPTHQPSEWEPES